MKLVSQRSRIVGVAKRWRNQYERRAGPMIQEKADVLRRLEALDLSTATAADVDAIIGNPTWTSCRCDECGERAGDTIEIGEPPDCESATVNICLSCARRVALLIGHPGPPVPPP